MARIIRSQAEDAARIQAEEQKAKEQEEKARARLNELSEELGKIQEGLQQLSKSQEEAERDLEKVYEEEKKLLEKKEKKQSALKRIKDEKEKAQAELTRLNGEKAKLQNEIRSAKGLVIPHIPRRIRSVNQSDSETEITLISRYNTSLIIPDNSLFTKANVGDYVSYVGEDDKNTTTWRVWKKTDSNVVITPVLDSSCRQLKLSGIDDYLDIVKNAGTQTDKINRACKEWYVNSSLGITTENIRSMTIEDINEACGYTPSEISTRYAYYPLGKYVGGTITYNGNTYIKQIHPDYLRNGYTIPRFYTYDGGGVEKVDANGYTYREPEKGNPVYVSNTLCEYSMLCYTHKDNPSIYVRELLGEYEGWLASTCVTLESFDKNAYFDICTTDGNRKVTAAWLASSNGGLHGWACGVHSLISLSSTLQAVGGDGSKNAPWEIRKI